MLGRFVLYFLTVVPNVQCSAVVSSCMILAGNELRCHNGHESRTLKGIKVKSFSALAGKLQENPPEASFQDSSGSSSEAGMASIKKLRKHTHMIYDIYIYIIYIYEIYIYIYDIYI